MRSAMKIPIILYVNLRRRLDTRRINIERLPENNLITLMSAFECGRQTFFMCERHMCL